MVHRGLIGPPSAGWLKVPREQTAGAGDLGQLWLFCSPGVRQERPHNPVKGTWAKTEKPESGGDPAGDLGGQSPETEVTPGGG
jgi:hypothetical protein